MKVYLVASIGIGISLFAASPSMGQQSSSVTQVSGEAPIAAVQPVRHIEVITPDEYNLMFEWSLQEGAPKGYTDINFYLQGGESIIVNIAQARITWDARAYQFKSVVRTVAKKKKNRRSDLAVTAVRPSGKPHLNVELSFAQRMGRPNLSSVFLGTMRFKNYSGKGSSDFTFELIEGFESDAEGEDITSQIVVEGQELESGCCDD